LPLDEFTAARNELVKRLRKAGDREAADEIARLRKPPVSAWAINQLARRRPDEVAELVASGAELAEAQKEALAGAAADAFDAAQKRQRAAIQALTRSSREVLEEAGHSASPQTISRIAASLRAASLDDAGRELLTRGRLEDDYEGTGLMLLAGVKPKRPARPPRRPPPGRRKDTDKEQLAAARERRREAAGTERALRREAEQAEKAAERARREADDAAERARAARAEAEDAREALEQADADLERLRG
jgi:hypothetical protein